MNFHFGGLEERVMYADLICWSVFFLAVGLMLALGWGYNATVREPQATDQLGHWL